MADNDARPEFNPKYRIVGAIVIVALLVIFVPMILSEREPPPELKAVIEIPARGEATETKVVVTPVEREVSKSKDIMESPPTSAIPAPITEGAAKPETRPVAPVETRDSVKTPAVVNAKENSTNASALPDKTVKGWIVQVGTFTNTDNTVRLREKLKSRGHKAYMESATVAGKKALRLRVGPFHDKEQALKALAQVRKETGLKGAVQVYP